jgi:predicted AAA+ superfamily ATPase
MTIQRDRYLQQLIGSRFNGQVKVITGIRRSGKSYLLFKIYYEHLLASGVDKNSIIQIMLDDDTYELLRDPSQLSRYIRSYITDKNQKYYVFLDEVQYAISQEEMKNPDKPIKLYSVLNGLLHLGNVDIYVTGSNSKFLSNDVMTEFRGRGDVIHVYPLSFKEFFDHVGGEKAETYEQYAMYGGMPFTLSKHSDEQKMQYLSSLFAEVYFKDIIERYTIELENILGQLTDSLCSSIGSLTNANKIARTITSARGKRISSETIAKYIEYLSDSFLFREAKRFDVKGKRYFHYPNKYYCTDIGLRNARLNFRQQEESHIMENIIFNELLLRGYRVDVGVIEITETATNGSRRQKQCEIDFIANSGSAKYYIQAALNVEIEEKREKELRPLLSVNDSFKKILVTKTYAKPWTDEKGILHIGLYQFLLDENSLKL